MSNNPMKKPVHLRNGITKKVPFGRILRTEDENGREYQLHATKGWRSYRSTT